MNTDLDNATRDIQDRSAELYHAIGKVNDAVHKAPKVAYGSGDVDEWHKQRNDAVKAMHDCVHRLGAAVQAHHNAHAELMKLTGYDPKAVALSADREQRDAAHAEGQAQGAAYRKEQLAARGITDDERAELLGRGKPHTTHCV